MSGPPSGHEPWPADWRDRHALRSRLLLPPDGRAVGAAAVRAAAVRAPIVVAAAIMRAAAIMTVVASLAAAAVRICDLRAGPHRDVISLQREPHPVPHAQHVGEVTWQLQPAGPVEHGELLAVVGPGAPAGVIGLAVARSE